MRVAKRPGQDHGEIVIKKSAGKHQHDEHGGAWKVAFADFCLALMCLFLVLWVLAARDKEEVMAALSAGGASSMTLEKQGPHMIGEFVPGEVIPKQPVLENAQDEAKGQEDVKKVLESPEELHLLSQRVKQIGAQVGMASHITTVVTSEGLRILIHDTEKAGMFRSGSAEPSGDFARLLRRIGPMFQAIENQLVIAGHTDAVPFNSSTPFAASNWSLSMERALAARAHMLVGGMPSTSVLQVLGMAEMAPVEPEKPNAPVNRRVELLVTTKAHAGHVLDTFGALPERIELTPGLEHAPAAADTEVLQLLREQLKRFGGSHVQGNSAREADAALSEGI